jgi:regulator of nonsense transcripts 1
MKGPKGCPLNTLVVDEASQIHVGDYIPVFYNKKYGTLRKACFIGDDKQCKYLFVLSVSSIDI